MSARVSKRAKVAPADEALDSATAEFVAYIARELARQYLATMQDVVETEVHSNNNK